MSVSLCLSQVRLPFVLASERVFIHILTEDALACQSTSAGEKAPLAACLPCSINNASRHNPNLTSPWPASEQHQWYMGTSGRASVLSFLSVMDGDFCRPVNTQSEPHCPDLRYSSTQVTHSEARHFNHSEHQLYTAKIGAWVCECVCACVRARLFVLVSHSVKHCCNHTAIGKCLHF